jgi:uncharacterized membrane protein
VLTTKRADRLRVVAAAAAVAGVTVFDAVTARELGRGPIRRLAGRIGADRGVEVSKAITVGCSPDEAYRYWRDLENWPRFMSHLVSVVAQDGRSTWRARAPAGMTVEWQAEVIEDRANELFAWTSLEGQEVHSAGAVRFESAPGKRGTEVSLVLRYRPPARGRGATAAEVFGRDPAGQIADDLRRFKQLVETGEVIQSDVSSAVGGRPARPPETLVEEGAR